MEILLVSVSCSLICHIALESCAGVIKYNGNSVCDWQFFRDYCYSGPIQTYPDIF